MENEIHVVVKDLLFCAFFNANIGVFCRVYYFLNVCIVVKSIFGDLDVLLHIQITCSRTGPRSTSQNKKRFCYFVVMYITSETVIFDLRVS